MKNKKVQLLLIMLCIFVPVTLTGCWGAREINELKIAVGLGVDKSEDNVLLTAQIVKPSEAVKTSGGGGGSGKAFWNIDGTGKSIFEAIRNITQQIGYKVYVAHSSVIIFGSEIAHEGIDNYIDFFNCLLCNTGLFFYFHVNKNFVIFYFRYEFGSFI